MSERHQGGCLCGDIRYAVVGAPLRVTHCMCRFCQKMTGAPMNTLLGFHKQSFELLHRQPRIHTHVSEGSGKKIYLNSCSNCGSTPFLTLERFPDAAGVLAGSFDDAGWFPRSPENSKYIFANFAQKGTLVRAGYPVFAEHAAELDGTPCEPMIFDDHHVIGEFEVCDA